MDIVEKMKKHILRGDVFQIVPSRAYNQGFLGDEFNVYRCLRSINPSPYLFYFDYGSFKLFGSSPEAQITIKDNVANIFPIAGLLSVPEMMRKMQSWHVSWSRTLKTVQSM